VNVAVTGFGLVLPHREPGLDIRAEVPEKKSLKLMERAARLGVVAVGRALTSRPGWNDVPPERRGLFVGTRPEGALGDLEEALRLARGASGVDVVRFGQVGNEVVHPLWLVKGLSNNIMGYACAWWDLRGPTSNRCEGRVSGLSAILEAARAVGEGRVDLAVAGGADSLPWGEGAAFVVLERREGAHFCGHVCFDPHVEDGPRVDGLDLGAASGAVAFVDRGWAAEAGDADSGLRVTVDARGRSA
jgi:3-oxoacyl-(acyl-carrier-protein) synthase